MASRLVRKVPGAHGVPGLLSHRQDGLPTNWPVVGALPAITANAAHLAHLPVADRSSSCAAGLSYIIKGPWASPVDVIVTADPAKVAHMFTANLGNYPRATSPPADRGATGRTC